MIKNYDTLFSYLFKRQGYKCADCGKYKDIKLDLCHNLSRTQKNIDACPDFIDSMLNLFVMHNNENVNRVKPKDHRGRIRKQITREQAERYQAFLTSTGIDEFGLHWNRYNYLFYKVDGHITKSWHPYYPDTNKKPIHEKMRLFVNGYTKKLF
ncbi:MAG: hypothetical protein ACYDEI_00215 [Erysipelotrichaceae bacterium]